MSNELLLVGSIPLDTPQEVFQAFMARFPERIAAARKYLPEFGLGAYCGFGRLPPAELLGILADHLKAVEIVARR